MIFLVIIIGILVASWAALVLVVERVVAPRLAAFCGGDWRFGVARLLVLGYCRLLHRVRFDGADELRNDIAAGPLIVVANHNAGIDPLLIQSGCRPLIRWMMADDMMVSGLDGLWQWARVIPVRRDARDTTALRAALRHLADGGTVGIFPEGGITRPSGRLRPFMAGVGLLAAKSRAPILLAFIEGAPVAPSAFGSLWRRSRSRIRFELLPAVDPAGRPGDAAAAVAERLRVRLAALSGWSMADEGVDGESADAEEDLGSPATWP